eukprot:222771-Heterocapsa_arctica.AAC.1
MREGCYASPNRAGGPWTTTTERTPPPRSDRANGTGEEGITLPDGTYEGVPARGVSAVQESRRNCGQGGSVALDCS